MKKKAWIGIAIVTLMIFFFKRHGQEDVQEYQSRVDFTLDVNQPAGGDNGEKSHPENGQISPEYEVASSQGRPEVVQTVEEQSQSSIENSEPLKTLRFQSLASLDQDLSSGRLESFEKSIAFMNVTYDILMDSVNLEQDVTDLIELIDQHIDQEDVARDLLEVLYHGVPSGHALRADIQGYLAENFEISKEDLVARETSSVVGN